jgi:periplasmic divalent cation tolerance protein
MSDALLVLTTVPTAEAGLEIARQAVRKRLCACGNLLPRMQSVYEWKGELKTDSEHLLIMKSTATRYSELEAWLRTVHPYELPEIIAAPIERGLAEYLDWIGTQTGP